jgi:CubicO group peptidase (beta-lactamase class C family)
MKKMKFCRGYIVYCNFLTSLRYMIKNSMRKPILLPTLHYIRIQLIILSIIFCSFNVLYSQSIPNSVKEKIDGLFEEWNSKDSPGCSIGIVRNDSLIYAKGYGIANLEYGISNSPSTIFDIASVSKQFTAYCIVLLVRQRKIDLNDDVRKYLTWFPDLHEKITIMNLLNHTSGIRDQWQLLEIAGTRLNDVVTQEQIIKILGKQQGLNFKPNEQSLYSNSGYTILAEIIKSVSGKSLREFADSAIFKPLKMTNTFFHDDYTVIVKNRAYSYSHTDSVTFSNRILNFSTVGPTSLFTNIVDMIKWVSNFYDTKAGDKKDIELLTGSKTKLNSGEQLDYALGIINGNYRGHHTYEHSGGMAGYRAIEVVFPDSKMGFVVFSNLDEFNVDIIYKVAGLFIKDISPKSIAQKQEKIDSTKAILKNPFLYQKFVGDCMDDAGVQFSFSVNNKKIYWNSYGMRFPMKAEKDTLYMLINPSVKFVCNVNTVGDTLITQYYHGELRTLRKYSNPIFSDEDLKGYTGKYYSEELDCSYSIVLKNHTLFLTNSKYSDSKIELKSPDHLINDNWWMDHLKVSRNLKGQINGFEVNSHGVQHLLFSKIE